jgi:hypothetical protein
MLLVSVLFDMSFSSLFSMMSSVAGVAGCAMRVMSRFLVMTAFVVLGSFLVVLRSMPVML